MNSLRNQNFMTHWLASLALRISKEDFLAGVASGEYPKPVLNTAGIDYWDGLAIGRIFFQRRLASRKEAAQ